MPDLSEQLDALLVPLRLEQGACAWCGSEDFVASCPFCGTDNIDVDTEVCSRCREIVEPVDHCVECGEQRGTLPPRPYCAGCGLGAPGWTYGPSHGDLTEPVKELCPVCQPVGAKEEDNDG